MDPDRCYHKDGFTHNNTTHTSVTIVEYACKNGCGLTQRTIQGKHWPWRDRKNLKVG